MKRFWRGFFRASKESFSETGTGIVGVCIGLVFMAFLGMVLIPMLS